MEITIEQIRELQELREQNKDLIDLITCFRDDAYAAISGELTYDEICNDMYRIAEEYLKDIDNPKLRGA